MDFLLEERRTERREAEGRESDEQGARGKRDGAEKRERERERESWLLLVDWLVRFEGN